MDFKRTPSYSLHNFSAKYLVTSSLTLETAQPIYAKLRGYLAIREDQMAPAYYSGELALFRSPGAAWFHPIKWEPRLKYGWRRLTFAEFIELYGIEVEA